jgi:DcuC family C4-dicarboxylate transporter
LLGILVIAVAVWAIVRELEVRLVLIVAALALGLIAWNPQAVVREFLATLTNERFVIPLCCGMGFARVLKHTECDQHLVHLLVRPLTTVRFLLVPGTVLVGFLVNMPIVSQTSTAVTIGSVVIPILRAAKLSPVTIGAALLLGCSIGGELLNPGAPELQTTVAVSQKVADEINQRSATHDLARIAASTVGQSVLPIGCTPVATTTSLLLAGMPVAPALRPQDYDFDRCVKNIMPLNFIGLLVGTLVFWFMAHRYEQRQAGERTMDEAEAPEFRVNWIKAAVPLLPLMFLNLSSYPFRLLELDPAWVETLGSDGKPSRVFGTRLIGFSMMLGVLAAALATPTRLKGVAASFFEGAGYGYANIVSLIVVANCFGQAIREVGIAETIGGIIQRFPDALMPAAGMLPLAFAALCGSGMASAQSLFGFFAEPALKLGIDPTHVGAVVSLASAAGRTMSPVAAVTLMCARMTGTTPLDLSKQVVIPLLISIAFIIVIAMIIVPAA